LNFTVTAGQSALCPPSNEPTSWFKVVGPPTNGLIGAVCNGTRGNFSAGPVVLVGGSPDANGVASLSISTPVVIGAQDPSALDDNFNCWRIESNGTGFVDCDGGSNVDGAVTVNSNTTAAPPPPDWDDAWLTAPSGVTNSGAGAALIPITIKTQNAVACPAPDDASWAAITPHHTVAVTGTATTTITNARKCPGGSGLVGNCPNPPYVVSLAGANFNCSNWTTNSGAKIVIPNLDLDVDFGTALGATLGIGDIAETLRLND
jgi:hypothetical protein